MLNFHIKDGPNADIIIVSHASKATPQFGFNCGIREFWQDSWDATKSELKDNLISMEAVSFVEQSDLDKTLTKDEGR